MKTSIGKRHGFTLAEALIAVGVLALLTVFVGPNIFGFRDKQNFELDTQNVVNALRNAQSRAIAGERGSSWGLYVVNATSTQDYYDIFFGDAYASSSVVTHNELQTSSQFIDPTQGNARSIIFAAQNGQVATTTSITIERTNGSQVRVITISPIGQIESLEATLAAPSVTTVAASGVGFSFAQLNGTVNPNGDATTYWFEYGTSPSYGSSTSPISAGSGASSVNAATSLSLLDSSTTYYFRIVAENNYGTSYGSQLSFSTTAATPPTVTTASTTNITTSSSTFNGTVTANGTATTLWFEYGTSLSYGSSTSPQSAGSGVLPIFLSTSTEGLAPGSQYYVRAVANNSGGTVYGDSDTFTTDSAAYSLKRTFELDDLGSSYLPHDFEKKATDAWSRYSVVATPADAAGYAPPNLTHSLKGNFDATGMSMYWILPVPRTTNQPTRVSFVEKGTRYRDDPGMYAINATSSDTLGRFGVFIEDYTTNAFLNVYDSLETYFSSTVPVSWIDPTYWIETRLQWDGATLSVWFKRLQTGATIGPYTITPDTKNPFTPYNFVRYNYYNGLNQSGSAYLAGVWIGDITADWPTW